MSYRKCKNCGTGTKPKDFYGKTGVCTKCVVEKRNNTIQSKKIVTLDLSNEPEILRNLTKDSKAFNKTPEELIIGELRFLANQRKTVLEEVKIVPFNTIPIETNSVTSPPLGDYKINV